MYIHINGQAQFRYENKRLTSFINNTARSTPYMIHHQHDSSSLYNSNKHISSSFSTTFGAITHGILSLLAKPCTAKYQKTGWSWVVENILNVGKTNKTVFSNSNWVRVLSSCKRYITPRGFHYIKHSQLFAWFGYERVNPKPSRLVTRDLSSRYLFYYEQQNKRTAVYISQLTHARQEVMQSLANAISR